jgi:hypothetical protein
MLASIPIFAGRVCSIDHFPSTEVRRRADHGRSAHDADAVGRMLESRAKMSEETQMSAIFEGFIPYLVLVRFDKDGDDLKRRLAESVPALKEGLADIGKVQFVEMSYDGSMVAYLVAANPRFESVLQVQSHLQLPQSGRSPALVNQDKVLVVSLETGTASRLERTTSWLREFELLSE